MCGYNLNRQQSGERKIKLAPTWLEPPRKSIIDLVHRWTPRVDVLIDRSRFILAVTIHFITLLSSFPIKLMAERSRHDRPPRGNSRNDLSREARHVIVHVNIRFPECIVLRSSRGRLLIRLPFRIPGADVSESPSRPIVLGPSRCSLQPFPSSSFPISPPWHGSSLLLLGGLDLSFHTRSPLVQR